MRQSLQRVGAFFVLTAAAGVLGTSCVDNESSMFIRGCLAFPADSCTVSPDASAKQLFSGVLDPAQADFSCPLLLGNQLVARGDSKQVRTETSRIVIHSAVVTIYDSTKGQTFQTFTVPASGFIDPGTTASPGLGAANVLMLDRVTARAHAGETLLSGVILQGRTLGGLELETAEWTFPIQVVAPSSLCNISPCLPGSTNTDMPKETCHPGNNTITDCRQGCVCLPGTGDCAPLGCRASASSTGVCANCLSNADCTAPATCAPTGLCQ
ncbi:MAG: hypothetical protein ABI134_28625 [Byssovorax sp.]